MKFSRRRALMAATAATLLETPAFAATPKSQTAINSWDKTCDVVVAGGGAAGVMAAINAAKVGARVLLIQAAVVLGGNSAISSGWIRSVNTKWHARKGIKDTAEAYAQNIIDYGAGTRSPAKAKAIAERSHEFVDFLIDWKVPFTDDEDRFNGGETLRIVKAQGGGGAVMKGLLRALKATKGVEVMTSTRLTAVIKDEKNEAVAGIEAEQGGRKILIRSRIRTRICPGASTRRRENPRLIATMRWVCLIKTKLGISLLSLTPTTTACCMRRQRSMTPTR